MILLHKSTFIYVVPYKNLFSFCITQPPPTLTFYSNILKKHMIH